MNTRHWDVLIIGGGTAGLSAAQMLGRARRRTLVIDAGEPRNRFAAHMHGVLGHDGLDPAELLARGRREARAYGVEIMDGRVTAHGIPPHRRRTPRRSRLPRPCPRRYHRAPTALIPRARAHGG